MQQSTDHNTCTFRRPCLSQSQLACTIFLGFRLDAQVADQAENRMLAAQAVLLHCCGLRGLWHPLRRDSGDSSSQRSSAEFGRKVTFA